MEHPVGEKNKKQGDDEARDREMCVIGAKIGGKG